MKNLIVLIILSLFVSITTASLYQDRVENTTSQTTKINRVQAAFSERDFGDLTSDTKEYLSRLQELDPNTRKLMFEELAKGNTTTLKERFGKSGLRFFETTRTLDGYLDSYPNVERLNELYSYWESSTNIVDFYSKWNSYAIPGFGMMFVKDLEQTKDGRRYLGFRLYNSGRVDWPESLQIEPFKATPDTGVDIKTLPETIKVLNQDGSAVKPGAVIDVYIDVTDIKAESGTNVYLVSTFEREKGQRCYVKPLLEELIRKRLNARLYVSL